jgi:CheY-like chemotaxis protein
MDDCEIVLIEDNPADVYLVQLALKENDVNCHMITFANGQEALKSLCQPLETQSVPDVILLDLNTPKSDGFEVLIRLRGTPHLANVPIAIVTSSQATSDKARTARLGVVRYIHKPSQLDEFIATVGQAVKEMLSQDSRPGRAGNLANSDQH